MLPVHKLGHFGSFRRERRRWAPVRLLRTVAIQHLDEFHSGQLRDERRMERTLSSLGLKNGSQMARSPITL